MCFKYIFNFRSRNNFKFSINKASFVWNVTSLISTI